ncbi:MAG TPA: hypothetical protein VGQ04_16790 [Chitinophagaceae bacterium]|jgi:hypothetical protein|nr:hypothetical protein [Chitinophagaceae bacterium]
MRNLILSVLVTTTLVSCGPSTKIEKSWMEPGASVTPGATNKTLVVAMVKDETSRRVIEDHLTKRIGNGAVSSYTIMPSGNEDALKQKVTEGNFTHVLLMRLADIEKETSYVPGTTTGYYGGYGRYYGYGYGMYSTPGYYTTDKNYFVETTVYSVSPDKLLWTATTKTVNPGKIEKTVNEIADIVSEKMKKDGFLK